MQAKRAHLIQEQTDSREHDLRLRVDVVWIILVYRVDQDIYDGLGEGNYDA